MKLANRTVYGMILFLFGWMLVYAHRDYRGLESLNPFYALSVNGGYLLCYAVFMAAGWGLLIRLLLGRFFVKPEPKMRFPYRKK